MQVLWFWDPILTCVGMGRLGDACGGFLTPTSSSWIPAGCLRIHLNSDTTYLKIASDPTS